mgnify:FL=1
MKKVFLITVLILSIFTITSAKTPITNKKILHASATGLNEGEYSTVIVPEYITVTKINSEKVNIKNSVIIIAPGEYTFKSKIYKDFSKSFIFEIESNKFYIVEAFKNPERSGGKTAYTLIEIPKENAENYINGNHFD